MPALHWWSLPRWSRRRRPSGSASIRCSDRSFWARCSRATRDGELLTERIEPLTVTLLLPLFFAFTGLRTNIHLLPSAALIAETALIVLLAIVGKAVAPAIIAKTHGFSWREALALGALMNTRGLVELVVLNIGVDIGLLPPMLFTMLALMALVTTAMTSPLLAWLGFGATGNE